MQASGKKAVLMGVPLGMLIGFAGAVYAADARLDEASVRVEQALALLRAATNDDVRGAEFAGHRRKAIELLVRANAEIAKAKDFADKPRPAPSGSPGPKPGPGPKPEPVPKPDPPKPDPSAKPPKPLPVPGPKPSPIGK